MEAFQTFLTYLRKQYPSVEFHEHDADTNVREMEAMYPSVLLLLQKKPDFFQTERILFGVNLSDLEVTDELWKNLDMCLLSSLFHGDIKQKLGTILNTAKSVWSNSGETNSEVERILNDEKTEDYLQELYEYATNLRSAKVIADIFEEIANDSFGLSIENPMELVEMIRDPENPVMKKAIESVQKHIRTKIESGQITQQQLMSDVEGIKAKLQSMFGGVLNDMLGGRRGETAPAVMMSNSPEARRQRMLARLQRKQREKTQR